MPFDSVSYAVFLNPEPPKDDSLGSRIQRSWHCQNARGQENRTYTLTCNMLTQYAQIQHVLSYILSHRCTQLSHVVYAYTQHALTCNTQHDTLPHMGSHVPMHILTHSHVYTLSHACTCSWYRLTVRHPCASPSCSYTSIQGEKGPRKTNLDPQSRPHLWPPPKDTWTDTETHNSRTHMQRSTPSLESRQPPKPQSTQRHTESHTDWARSTHRHKVTTSCSHTPKSSQKTAGPGTHPGEDCQDTGSAVLPALAQQPEPTLGPVSSTASK